jgi:transposase-like protein
MATRKNYSQQYRDEAIELVRKSEGKPLRKVAAELGVPQSVLNNWVRRSGGRAEPVAPVVASKTEQSQRIKQLERDLQRTREELAFAKKAAAFFARDLK